MKKNLFKKILPYTFLLSVFLGVGTNVYSQNLPSESSNGSNDESSLFPTDANGEANNTTSRGATSNGKGKYAQYEDIAKMQAAEKETDAIIENVSASSEDSQAAKYNKGKTGTATSSQISKAATGVIGCLGANILAQMISSTITSFISQNVSNITDVLFYVPTAEKGHTGANIKTDTSAKTGTVVSGSIFGFGASAIVFPSWDAIGYCIANEIITYVANSTIAWVKGGFEGNPAFIDNPGQFFKDMANLEASSFLQGLAYGSAGLNICEPFRAQIVLSIARSHLASQYGNGGAEGYNLGGFNGGGGNYKGGYGGCTLDDAQGNFKAFLNGDFNRGGWNSWLKVTQEEGNNPYSTYFNLQEQLNGSINKKADLVNQELGWGRGFLSFKTCEEGTPEQNKSGCKITTPGTVIEGQLQKTLGIAKDRLVLAEKFDQVIAVVVDQLIQTALNKVFEELED